MTRTAVRADLARSGRRAVSDLAILDSVGAVAVRYSVAIARPWIFLV